MDINVYENEIEKLLTGEISEIVVSKEHFFEFREIWLKHPKKNEIVGEAHLGGKLIYRKTDN